MELNSERFRRTPLWCRFVLFS